MVDFYVTIHLHVPPPPCTHTLPHHTCHQRCVWLCCPCVPGEHHLLLLSGLTHQHWRKKVNHSSPSLSLHSERTIHIILYMYKKNLALDNIYSVPTHHSEHCGRSVQNFPGTCSMAALPRGRDRMSMTDTQVMRAERRGKGVLGYGGMSLPVDSSHKAALPSLPLECTYCDRET